MHLVTLPMLAPARLVLLIITMGVLTLLYMRLGGLSMETRKTHRRRKLVVVVMVLSRRRRCERACNC